MSEELEGWNVLEIVEYIRFLNKELQGIQFSLENSIDVLAERVIEAEDKEEASGTEEQNNE